jgi:acyl-CoA thioester hydrolase
VSAYKNGNTFNPDERTAEFIITYRGGVYPLALDHMGHMNVMWYVGKFDEASWQLLARLGLTRTRCAREGREAVALDQRIDYRRELHAGDLITVRSRALEVNEKTLCMTHEMTNDQTGELAAVTVIVGLHIDAYLRRPVPCRLMCASAPFSWPEAISTSIPPLVTPGRPRQTLLVSELQFANNRGGLSNVD